LNIDCFAFIGLQISCILPIAPATLWYFTPVMALLPTAPKTMSLN
jgi:hypothetical protein